MERPQGSRDSRNLKCVVNEGAIGVLWALLSMQTPLQFHTTRSAERAFVQRLNGNGTAWTRV